MKHLEIKEVNTTLALLIHEIATNQDEIIITQNGAPIARVIPFTTKSEIPNNYPLREMPITISEDFDEAMPELWDALSN